MNCEENLIWCFAELLLCNHNEEANIKKKTYTKMYRPFLNRI